MYMDILKKLQALSPDTDIFEANENMFDYHVDARFTTKMSRERYEELEAEISKAYFENDKYSVRFSYDVSWYDYWVVKMGEDNPIYGIIEIKDPTCDLQEATNKLWQLYMDFIF